MRKHFLWVIGLFILGCNADKQSDTPQITKSKAESQELFLMLPDSRTGVTFQNTLEETPEANRLTYEYYYNGGGVASGDLDNDGLPELYFTGNLVADKLYKNQGEMKFEDITSGSGIEADGGWHTGVSFVDVNADGMLDIYICRSGWSTNPDERANRLYINKGNLKFEDQADKFGLNDTGHSLHAAFFDADRDGDLDVYILNHPEAKPDATNLAAYKVEVESGKYMTDRFYKFEGGKYVDRTKEAGLVNFGYRHGIAISDVNRDGWPDMYISSDFDDADLLYINKQDGTFQNEIENYMNHITMFSMGNDFADINNDGWTDLFVADMTPGDHARSKQNMASMNPAKFFGLANTGFHYQYMANSLQLNNGNGSFSDIANMAGVSSTDWSWSTLFGDFDLDGYQDLYVTNGIKRDVLNNDVRIKVAEKVSSGEQISAFDVLDLMPSTKLENYVFRNRGDLTFEKLKESWITSYPAQSNGATLADLDGDGDLDMVSNNVDQSAHILSNQSANQGKGSFLKLKLIGSDKNTFAIGARVDLQTDKDEYVRELYVSRGFYSGMDPIIHFGFPGDETPTSLSILWPDGTYEEMMFEESNSFITVEQSEDARPFEDLYFANGFKEEDPSGVGLVYSHRENNFDEFQKEILIPHRQSTQGPLTAKGDVNGDGYEDFYLGGSKGFPAIMFAGSQNGKFNRIPNPVFEQDKGHEDGGALFFDLEGDGDLDLYVASGGYSEKPQSPLLKDRLYINDGQGKFAKSSAHPGAVGSNMTVKAVDYDKDGDLDVFVGGRVVPGTYPLPADSYLLENRGGSLVDVTKKVFPSLEKFGLLTSAVFTDFDQDGDQDAVLAGEWTDILFYKNEDGVFNLCTECGAERNLSGWWYSLELFDADGDGDDDIVAGNIGLNNKFHPAEDHPFKVYAHDFDQNGTLDIVLSKISRDNYVPTRGRECSSQQMPMILDKFPTYKSYAESTLEEIYGEDALNQAYKAEAVEFASVVLINEGGGKFTDKLLPNEVQISPVRSIIVGDLNEDGKDDLILAGNHFGAEVETVRYDAGCGALLVGKGNGKFEPVAPFLSGLNLRNDVRSILYIEKSRMLIVTNNQGPIQVFRKDIQEIDVMI